MTREGRGAQVRRAATKPTAARQTHYADQSPNRMFEQPPAGSVSTAKSVEPGAPTKAETNAAEPVRPEPPKAEPSKAGQTKNLQKLFGI
jgi:hypothetical protein